jgi:hypothetical protein
LPHDHEKADSHDERWLMVERLMSRLRLDVSRQRSAAYVAAAAVAVGMVAWSAASISTIGVPWWRFLLAVLVTGFVCWGIGGAVQLALGMDAGERCAPFPRLALGFAATTALMPLLALTRVGATIVALVIGILSVCCWAFMLRRGSTKPRLPSLSSATDWMLLAVILRVCTAGSQFVSVSRSDTWLTQNWDLTWHLAHVKAGLFRGIPLAHSPLLAGAPQSSYHPAFDDFATVLIKGLGLPVDAGFYGVALPLLGVAFLVGLMALTNYATGSRWAHYFTLLVFAGVALLPGSFAEKPSFAYFVNNPPAATAVVAAAMSVALFARGFAGHNKRYLVGAAILAGVTVCMKAHTAIALGPAFVCAAGVLAWRRRSVSLFVVPVIVALGAAALCYLPTRGYGGGQLGVDFGAFARWARPGANSFVAAADWITRGHGPRGDGLFLVAYVFGSLLAWRAVPAACALLRWPPLESAEDERSASAANAYLVWFVIWATILGFTIVQVGVGAFSPYNISYHTLNNVIWVGAVLAGVSIYRIARHLLGPTPRKWLSVVALTGLLALTPLAMRGVEHVRQVGTAKVETSLYELLREVPKYTEADAVVAQDFETVWDAWVSGVSGRPAVLERGGTWRGYRLAEAERRELLLTALYEAPTPAAAREAASDLGVRYAIVGPDDPPALLEGGLELVRVGDWALVEFR